MQVKQVHQDTQQGADNQGVFGQGQYRAAQTFLAAGTVVIHHQHAQDIGQNNHVGHEKTGQRYAFTAEQRLRQRDKHIRVIPDSPLKN
ncbi:hypothetical protein D3C80_1842740 [compost metagenome]